LSIKKKNKEVFKYEKLNDVALKLLAKAAYANAEKEANSACIMNMVIDNF
jgi:cyclic lactone autoinducer peptide